MNTEEGSLKLKEQEIRLACFESAVRVRSMGRFRGDDNKLFKETLDEAKSLYSWVKDEH